MKKDSKIENYGEKEFQEFCQIILIAENENEIESLKKASENNQYLSGRYDNNLINAEIGEKIKIDFEFAYVLNNNSDINIGEFLDKIERENDRIEIS